VVFSSINNHKTNFRLSTQLNKHIKKTTTYDIENPGPGLGQVQKRGRVKSINGIQTPTSW
jgi:hypothetical protein